MNMELYGGSITFEQTEAIERKIELYGGSITFEQTIEERSFPFEETGIAGMAVILEMNEADKVVREVTLIRGMTITLIDFPIFSFQIRTRRL